MAGPQKLRGGELTLDADGRYVHVYRQSSLGDLDMCLEKGRLTLSGELERWETAAATIGTAVHEGIEANLMELMFDDADMNLSVTVEIAQQAFSDLLVLPNFKWGDEDEESARGLIEHCLTSWHEEIRPGLQPAGLEIPFKDLVIHEDDERVIKINGTMDYLDAVTGLGDWKTSGQKYQAWEKDRWAIQPTVYTLASRLLGIECAQAEYVPFEFYVMLKKGSTRTQRVRVVRHKGDWNWLIEKCVAVSKLIEADVSVWPKNDNGWWCSSKWCPAWDSCKGNHYGDDWPRPSVPADGAVDRWVQVPNPTAT